MVEGNHIAGILGLATAGNKGGVVANVGADGEAPYRTKGLADYSVHDIVVGPGGGCLPAEQKSADLEGWLALEERVLRCTNLGIVEPRMRVLAK